MEPTLDTTVSAPEPQPVRATPTPSVTLSTVLTTGLVAVLVAGGLVLTVREELRGDIVTATLAQQEDLTRIAKKISALESQIAELSARPTTDNAIIDGLKNDLFNAKSTIDGLTGRISTLEQKPEPAAGNTALLSLRAAILSGNAYDTELSHWQKAHPKSDLRLAHLGEYADEGLPSENGLRAELKTLLARTNAATPLDDQGLVGRVNRHLPGFITVKKKAALSPEMQALQTEAESASLERLNGLVGELPPAQHVAFAAWQEKAKARLSALHELQEMDGAQ